MSPNPSAFHYPLLIQISLWTHVGAAVLTLVKPSLWQWTLGVLVVDHLIITAATLWPRSGWLGPNLLRLPDPQQRVAITIDDGPDPAVTPKVLDILDQHDVKASFFCVGEKVRQHPELAREIVARGHTLENHTDRHPHSFSVMGPKSIRKEIVSAQDIIRDATGFTPRYFRAPAGLRNAFLNRILFQNGLKQASWTRRGFDTVETNPDKVLARLTHKLAAGDILLLHDGNAAGKTPIILEVLPRLLERIAQKGLRASALP
ncbi:MAG: polysaccharide deacetylase family protein [Rhodocyclaceae bacterium]